MLATLRRFRPLILLLLAFSPGGMGTVLPVVHPCPVDMPTMAHGGVAAMSHRGGMGSHDAAALPAAHRMPGQPGAHGSTCHCPDACCPSSPVVAPTTFALAILRAGAVARPQAPPRSWSPPAARAIDLLPPSTAPPTLV
jgi:hypothetical protein